MTEEKNNVNCYTVQLPAWPSPTHALKYMVGFAAIFAAMMMTAMSLFFACPLIGAAIAIAIIIKLPRG